MEEIDERVKKIVREELRDTQKLLAEQSALIKDMYSLMRGNGEKRDVYRSLLQVGLC